MSGSGDPARAPGNVAPAADDEATLNVAPSASAAPADAAEPAPPRTEPERRTGTAPPAAAGPGGLVSAAVTHPGAVRSRNEDSFVDRPDLGLWAVADGAGGHGAGDYAANAVREALDSIPPGLSAAEMLAQLRLRLAAVNAALREEAARRGPGRVIASTVVALLARGDHFACLWAGDSRAYLLRGGVLQRLSRDHSLVQELIDQGAIGEAEAEDHPQGNVITRAVGAAPTLELDKVTGRVVPGDRFLLCSDGLIRVVREAEIAEALAAAGDAAEALVRLAVERGARDNVTVIALARPGGGPAAGGA
ncbi:PP2C family protein-serine/threonine phosphatase [Caldovatus aquaticus]|uniref:Protein phosphatase 2C domain-containing protein n=1 Tax=Caldovatus aquaticus TaxID=2865671 RepID=A0ABS7F3X0_9PROT|nr:protein phosphatase 2C domain-containing protein [Caldovatus aquaticus]MBW8270233.1 protein phosphatase 2C domain-containing protein [Caldovatus aquaticus]